MMMKKLIAGATLVATLVGSAAPALANSDTSTASTPAVTAPATAESTGTTSADTAAEAETTAVEAEIIAASEDGAELESVSLTPDKLFYFLKVWVEKVQLALTRDAALRAALLEKQAQTRLAEAVQMAEAGKADLAQRAMAEAQAKLEAAGKEIEVATDGGKSLDRLVDQIEADQTRFARAVTSILEELPAETQAELEPLTADLLVLVAATQDAATQDEAPAQEAEQAAEEAGLKEELSSLQPRMVLVLKAMAQASGKDLAEVYAMYKQNPGLGRIAKELGLKMGPVQHAAQIEWKKAKVKVEIEVEVEQDEEDQDEEEIAPALQVLQTLSIGSKAQADDDDDDDDDDDEKGPKGAEEWADKGQKKKGGKGRGQDKD